MSGKLHVSDVRLSSDDPDGLKGCSTAGVANVPESFGDNELEDLTHQRCQLSYKHRFLFVLESAENIIAETTIIQNFSYVLQLINADSR